MTVKTFDPFLHLFDPGIEDTAPDCESGVTHVLSLCSVSEVFL